MKIFISYSRLDIDLCRDFRRHLDGLKREKEVQAWHDEEILVGKVWRAEIRDAIHAADVVVLLLSSGFMASRFIWDQELPAILAQAQRGACIVAPVVVKSVADWEASFEHLQALPAGGTPVDMHPNHDAVWATVVRAILKRAQDAGLPRTKTGDGKVFHVPRAENPFFTGRDDALAWIARTLNQNNRNRARPVALLHGTGGVGKSETAAQYAHAHRDAYQVVWWIDAETAGGRDEGFRRLAERLALPGVDARDPSAIRGAVKDWLAGKGGWLLLFDNAESPDHLRDWLPQRAGGHLLITSRNPAWRRIADELPVDAWDIPTAAGYLIDRTGEENATAAADLATELDGLPLACEHAAAYAETAGIGLGEYLRRLRRDFGQAAEPVKRTFQMAMQAAAGEAPSAATLMDLCARFAAEPIPRRVFSGEKAAKVLDGVDDFAVDAAFAALRKRGLTQGRDEIIIHRLVRETARQDKTPDAAQSLDLAGLKLATAAFPKKTQDARTWADCAALRPHAETLLTAVADNDAPPGTVDLLCNQLGMYLKQRGDYPSALILLQRSLKLYEAHFGPTSGETATALSNLAMLLKAMGGLGEAEDYARRALKIDQDNLGPNDPMVALRLSNLATILMDQGRWGEAEDLLRRALAIFEAAFGPDHPDVAIALSNLAAALDGLGRQGEAKPLKKRALEITRKEYGDDHPTIAYFYNNLGTTLFALGDSAGAAGLLRKALAIREKWLGPNHPLTQQAHRNVEAAEAASRKKAAQGDDEH